MPKTKAKRVLLLTVGTGTAEQFEATVLAPIAKSVRKGEFARVLLLPSQTTQDNARELERLIADRPMELMPLPEKGMEDDPDRCFDHFDQVIAGLLREGFSAADLMADITRGTKTMSAALALAAVRHGVPTLRYITGQRGPGGVVVPGTEVVHEFSTHQIQARRDVDLALHLIYRWNFAAVDAVLPGTTGPFSKLLPRWLFQEAQTLRAVAAFYGAWDCFDYAGACKVAFPTDADLPAHLEPLIPTPETRTWLKKLTEPVLDPGRLEAVPQLSRLAQDLLANAERRLKMGQYEDAMIRIYRVLELAARMALIKTCPTSDLRTNDWTVWNMVEAVRKKGDRKIGEELRSIARDQVFGTSGRNRSILVHGYAARGLSKDADAYQSTLDKLRKLIGSIGGSSGGDAAIQQTEFPSWRVD